MSRLPTVLRRASRGASHLRRRRAMRRQAVAAAVAIGLIVVVTVLVFTKPNPFAHPYRLRAAFASSNELKLGSTVRIAGMDVGRVDGIEPGPHHTTVVSMRVDDRSVPIHRDARLSILPRLVLEGNFYVDVSPGTPAAPLLPSGGTIPLRQTSDPVQLDQFFDIFQRPTRAAFQGMVGQLSAGLGSRPGGGPTGAQGMRDAARELDAALGGLTQTSRAFRGTQPGDLTRTISSTGDVTAQLAQDPATLADFVTNYDRTFAALASEDRRLAQTIGGFDATMRVAPRSLRSIDAALPVLTRFGRALRPGLRAAPAPLRAASGMLTQVDGLVSRPELPALLTRLQPVTTSLPRLEGWLDELMPLATRLSRCISRTVVPTLDKVVPDGDFTTGRPVWKDFLDMTVALAGASSDFDGDGTAIRTGIISSKQAVSGILPGIGSVAANGQISGVRPQWLGYGVSPPWRPDQWCDQQPLPNLGLRDGSAPAALRATSSHPFTAAQRRLAAKVLRGALRVGRRGR